MSRLAGEGGLANVFVGKPAPAVLAKDIQFTA
jgi:hypothetical protein